MIVDKRPERTTQMIELYCDWRMRCEEVRASYEQFGDAEKADRALSYAWMRMPAHQHAYL